MNRSRFIGIASGVAALLATPILAQTSPPSRPAPTSAPNPAPAISSAAPPGALYRAQNRWRGRALIGTVVFDDNGRRIAAINDLLVDDDGRIDQAILSIGRLRNRLVAVPFSQLRFVTGVPGGNPDAPPIEDVPAPLATAPNAYHLVLPGASRDSLSKLPPFRFNP